jgi:hypothetical protein
MKRLVSFILFLLFLFISDGYYLYFRYLQHNINTEVQNEIRKGLKEENLSLIIVPLNGRQEILWTKKDKEFRYKGSMYDVVSTEVRGQKIYYYCLDDVREKQLIARYDRNNRRRTKTLMNLKRVMGSKYFTEKSSFTIDLCKTGILFSEYQEQYLSIIPETNSPPPKFNFFS